MTIANVCEAVWVSPTYSARMHAKNLNVSEQTLRQILHDDLHFHPYEILSTQQLLPASYVARIAFSETMLKKLQSKEIPVDGSITDKAHFYQNGDVNKQNLNSTC